MGAYGPKIPNEILEKVISFTLLDKLQWVNHTTNYEKCYKSSYNGIDYTLYCPVSCWVLSLNGNHRYERFEFGWCTPLDFIYLVKQSASKVKTKQESDIISVLNWMDN